LYLGSWSLLPASRVLSPSKLKTYNIKHITCNSSFPKIQPKQALFRA
jgi:hypothetical protein